MNKFSIASKSNQELILIIEHPEDYVEQLVGLATKELDNRNLSECELIITAEKLYRAKCKKLFVSSPFKVGMFKLPYSSIIEGARCKSLMKIEFEIFMSNKDALNSGLGRYS